MSAIYVEITDTKGSAPRDAGTVMMVTYDTVNGTIGGGALELQAIHHARDMLADDIAEHETTIPLGPSLGQCCGGAVSLRYSRNPAFTDNDQFVAHPPHTGPRKPLWVWGAGHVGRALVRQAAPIGAFDITWVDSALDRFPEHIPPDVTQIPATDMPLLVPHAPTNAHHVILTYSHEIDLNLCAALLRHGFASCGLIGSKTKRTRFYNRLEKIGLNPVTLTCPIGDKALGKHPDAIAAGTIRALRAQEECA